MRKKILVVLAVVGCVGLVGATTACSPHLFRHAVGAAVITAAIVGTAHVLAHHDGHFHDQYCGCPRRYHHGRYVYYYGDRWEYYDHRSGRWYYYAEY